MVSIRAFPFGALRHYVSIRQYRYQTLIALNAPLDTELRLMDELAVQYLKTYQVWHHRRLLVQRTNDPAPELAFIANALQIDTKNYHTWSYRQWILAHFNNDALWRDELAFVERMLDGDLRNNSAWHHRFFVVFQSGVRKGDEDRDAVVRRELTCVAQQQQLWRWIVLNPFLSSSFVKTKIAIAPNNASAWNYLRGILDKTKTPYSIVQSFVTPYSVPHPEQHEAPLGDVVDLEDPLPSSGAQLPCVAAIEFVADIYETNGGEDLMKAIEVQQYSFFLPSMASLGANLDYSLHVKLWKSLAHKHDTMRKKYVNFVVRSPRQLN